MSIEQFAAIQQSVDRVNDLVQAIARYERQHGVYPEAVLMSPGSFRELKPNVFADVPPIDFILKDELTDGRIFLGSREDFNLA